MLRSFLSRIGFTATGIVYLTIGLLAARIAFLGTRDRVAGVPGALRHILSRPYGVFALWFVALGLAAFALWRFVRAASPRRGKLDRLRELGGGLGHAALAWVAFRILLRMQGNEQVAAKAGLAWLAAQPMGKAAVVIAGVCVAGAGLAAIYQGLTGRIRPEFAVSGLPRGAKGLAALAARIGFVAKGMVLLVIGYFLVRAAEQVDPGQVREIGGSLRVLSKPPFGPALMGVVALGLVVYGIYLLVVAAYRSRRTNSSI